MRRISKLFILFIISLCIVLLLPFVTAGEEPLAWYDAPNVSYPDKGIECGTGGLAPGIPIWFCWVDYNSRNMDHSFFNFSDVEAYYNSSSDSLVIGGETLTLSAFQDQDTTNKAGSGLLSSFIALIQSFF